jgi:hypothetical protein
VVEEKKGANPQQLEQKVIQRKVNTDPFGGSAGHKLSSDSTLDPREARLRAMAGGSNPMGAFPAPTVPHAAPSSVGPDPTAVFKKAQEEAADLAAAEKAFAEQEKQQNQLKTSNAPVENEEMHPVFANPPQRLRREISTKTVNQMSIFSSKREREDAAEAFFVIFDKMSEKAFKRLLLPRNLLNCKNWIVNS